MKKRNTETKNISRTLAIADIHGSLKSLKDVLDKCNYNPKKDRLIFLGDYVDGWSQSAETVEYLIDLKNKAPEGNAIFVRGNHDVWVEDWFKMGVDPLIWTMNGGKTTIESYLNTMLVGDKRHAKFFSEMVNWFIDEDNRLYIHGGWDYRSGSFPMSALYPVNAGTTAKECHWDRSLLAGAKSANSTRTEFNATKGFKNVYLGHTATKSHLPEKYGNLWIVDSGCGWHGKLTALDVETEEYYQSDYSKNHYPDEKGR